MTQNRPDAPPAWYSPRALQTDLLASVVVFLVALPLCMGIAIASGAPVAAGLVTGIVGGLVVGLLSGAPLQVSGPAAGLSVIIYDIVRQHGLETLGLVVLIAGLLQLAAGLLRLGQWFRAVSPAVIRGMLAGIGVLIFASQFHVMVDDKPKDSGLKNLLTIPEAVAKGLPWPELRPVEERQFRTQHLQEFGDLHAEQENIHEEVGEAVPELAFILPDAAADAAVKRTDEGRIDPAKIAAVRERFEPLIPRQEAINGELDRLTAELIEWKLTEGEGARAAGLRAAVEKARRANEQALEDLRETHVFNVRDSQARAAEAILGVENQLKSHDWAARIGLLTIAVIVGWQMTLGKKLKTVPAPLLAIVLATALTAALRLPVLYVEVPDRIFDALHFPSWGVLVGGDVGAILTGAAVIALVASAQTMLTAVAIDQMQTDSRTDYDRELTAQGIGNMICGSLGALPIAGVIVRTSVNLQAGGKTRLSTILHGLWLLVFVALLAGLLRMMPTSALAAILVYTGYKLVNPASVKELAKHGKGEVVVYLATLILIVAFDLLVGIAVGLLLAALRLLLSFSRLETTLEIDEQRNAATLHLRGAATFLRLPLLAAELEKVPPGAEVHVRFDGLEFVDHACLELLQSWGRQHESTGGPLHIEWQDLHARYNGNGHHAGSGTAASARGVA